MVFGADDESREPSPIACSVNARSNYVCNAVLATWRQFTEIAALNAHWTTRADLEAKAEAVEAAANAQPTRALRPTALPSIHGGQPSYVPSPAETSGWRSDSPEVDAPSP